MKRLGPGSAGHVEQSQVVAAPSNILRPPATTIGWITRRWGMMDIDSVVQLPEVDPMMKVLLRAQDSNGSLGAVEMTMAPGEAGPPLHLHRLHAESFYVLDGELTLRLGDTIIAGGPGTWACAPQGTPHTLANFSATPARVLCLFSPGGFERRFQRMLAGPNEAAALAELAEAERQTELLGPPMSPADRPAGDPAGR